MRIRTIWMKIQIMCWRCIPSKNRVFKIKRKYRKGGKVNLCQGLKDWIEEERMEGFVQGRMEGRAEGEKFFISLTGKLLKDGRMEDLQRAIEDKVYREWLYMKYGIS